ncbi:MAG: DUF1648 domain-containing protein [Acidimicrobiia bacterium]
MPASHRKTLLWKGLLYIGPLLVLVTIAAVQLAVSDRLPDPMAVHWGVDGVPDGFLPQAASLLLLGGIWIGFWALIFHSVRDSRGSIAFPVGVLYFLGGLLLVVQVSIVAAGLDTSHWSEADPFSWATLAVELLVGLALGVLAGVLASRIPTEPLPEAYEAPAVAIPEA